MHWVAAHVHAFDATGGLPGDRGVRQPALGRHPRRTATSPTSTPPTRRWRPTTAWPSSPPAATSPGTRPRSEAGVLLAERWILARLRNRALLQPGRGQRRHRRAGRRGSTTGRSRSWPGHAGAAVRGARPAGPAAAAGHPLRVRHLAAGQGQHRLPRRGPRRPPLLLACPTGWSARRVDVRLSAATVEVVPPPPPRRLPPARATPRATDRPGPHARVPPPPRRPGRRAASCAWAARDGPGHGQAGRGHPGRPAPPRAGLPILPGHRAPGRALRRPTAWRRPASGPWPCGPTATARSSRSCATGLDRQPLPPERPAPSHPDHDNLRGPDYYR